MGGGQSHEAVDLSQYPDDYKEIHRKVEDARMRLKMLKEEGLLKIKERKVEVYHFEKAKLKRHYQLINLGKTAQRYISFWEYARIVRRTFNSPTLVPIKQGSSSNFTVGSEQSIAPASKSTAIVKQSQAVQYTIFAFYEAYLLKKLHIAMMLKNQKKLHSKGWNDIVMYLYNEIPSLDQTFKLAENTFLISKYEHEGYVDQLKEANENHISAQKNLIKGLIEAPDDDDLSTGSISAGGRRRARASMFTKSYKPGTIRDSYEAPWMKNSRTKLKQSTEKAKSVNSIFEGEESLEDEEINPSKPKNRHVPMGIPDTLEIVPTPEGDNMTRDSAKKKKKKKKKKKMISDNGSVVSELSMGESMGSIHFR
jgi:hypothetical protein